MEDSPIFWRFDKVNANLLKRNHNSIDESISLWNTKVSSLYSHLMQIPSVWQEGWVEVETYEVDTDEYEKGKRFLNRLEHSDYDNILFFWSRKYSLFVSWSFFIDNWTDFCYPDDDNIAIIINENLLLTFCEENFTLYKKK